MGHGPMLGEELILWEIVEEHLDEAEFLIELWHSARISSLYSLEELAEGPEQRLDAHVDGLVVNGPHALRTVAWPAIDDEQEVPRIAAAALALLQSGDFAVLEVLDEAEDADPEDEDPEAATETAEADPDYPAELLDLERLPPPSDEDDARREAELADVQARLETMDQDEPERPALLEVEALLKASAPEDEDESAEDSTDSTDDPPAPLSGRAQGITMALGLCSHPKAGDHLRARVAKSKGDALAMLLQACADRGLDPGPGLTSALSHSNPVVVAAAVRAAAYGDRHRLLAPIEARLQHPSAEVRLAAMDTALGWGSRAAWDLAAQSYRTPGARSAMVWMACLGDDRHCKALIRLLEDEALRHDALWALGFSGRVPAIEACLRWIEDDDETTRRLAGEAITHILGLDVEDPNLWEDSTAQLQQPPPEIAGDAPEDDQDSLDVDLAGRPEDELPLPVAAAFRELWERVREGFTPGTRYLHGQPVGREGPGRLLSSLSCRRIDVVAREVVARTSGAIRWPGMVPALRHRQAASALAQLDLTRIRNPQS